MPEAKAVSILHLSDLHFGSPDSNYGDDDKADTPLSMRDNAFVNLHGILQDCIPHRMVDVVAVTGDITTHGKPEGFARFENETVALLKRLLRDPKAFCLVPGNHDVRWGLDPAKPDYFDVKFDGYSRLTRRIGATGALVPYGPLRADSGTVSFAAGKPLYVDPVKRLVVLCVNSSIRCGEVNAALRETLSSPIKAALAAVRAAARSLPKDERSRLNLRRLTSDLKDRLLVVDKHTLFDVPHITHPQLARLRIHLNRARTRLQPHWSSYAKIALLHHHLVPFKCQVTEYKAFESTADAASLLDLLSKFGFHLVLTGHKHQPYTEPVIFGDSGLLVVGGATVGGHPVSGTKQGIRYIELRPHNSGSVVRVADLPCNWEGDIVTKARDLIHDSEEHIVRGPQSERQKVFPAGIEGVIERQLYDNGFYRTDVLFKIHARELLKKGRFILVLTTVMSYRLVNRTQGKRKCEIKFSFDRHFGEIVKAKFNGKDYYTEQPELFTDRGLCLRSELDAGQAGRVYIRAREWWSIPHDTLLTSFDPATDLRVELRSKAPNVSFDLEPLYSWDNECDVREEDGAKVASFTRGVLPNQGVRLNWKIKGDRGMKSL